MKKVTNKCLVCGKRYKLPMDYKKKRNYYCRTCEEIHTTLDLLFRAIQERYSVDALEVYEAITEINSQNYMLENKNENTNNTKD